GNPEQCQNSSQTLPVRHQQLPVISWPMLISKLPGVASGEANNVPLPPEGGQLNSTLQLQEKFFFAFKRSHDWQNSEKEFDLTS
ncbi:hypothetical protein AVEN_2523-1, partial [Araneus ventricosus]